MIHIRSKICTPLLVLAALAAGRATVLPVARADAPRATAAKVRYALQYVHFARNSVARTQADLPRIAKVGEAMATRYMAGGEINMLSNSQGLYPELSGRAGGLMHYTWDPKRGAQQRANDMAIAGWDRAPDPGDLDQLKKFRAAGNYIVGFGPRGLPALAEFVPLCDVWFDTGLGADDRIVRLTDGQRVGHGNLLANMLNAWTLEGEFTGALTRHGLMPVFWKSFMYPDGRTWADTYANVKYHNDFKIAPIPAGKIGRAYLREMRANIGRFENNQMGHVANSVALINAEVTQGHKVPVLSVGHACSSYVGHYEDAVWAQHNSVAWDKASWTNFAATVPEGALVVRLGYTGVAPDEAAGYQSKNMRIVLITSINPDPAWKTPTDSPTFINMEWPYGDAAVSIKNYPIRILPPSGIMQIVAYESLNVEVLAKK
jgi:hypothetical protein